MQEPPWGSIGNFTGAATWLCVDCRAQWLRGRASDSRLREPGFESCAAVLKPSASFFTLPSSCSLSCINEYLVIDSCDYVYEQPSHINCSMWLDVFQGSWDGVWLNRSAGEVKCKSALSSPKDWILNYMKTYRYLVWLREPGFEYCTAVLKPLASFLTLHCSSSLSCINEYLAIDSCGYVYEQPLRISCSIRQDASHRSWDGVWLNRSSREVKGKALWAVLRTALYKNLPLQLRCIH